MATVDELINADGSVHPAEAKFRAELADLLNEELGVELVDDEGERPFEVATPRTIATKAEDHPFFAQFEQHYSSDRDALCDAVNVVHSYEELLSRLGYRITLTNQIHVQDCYQRVSQSGGIKAVLPYYDIPTQGSLPTLVNLDSTITTTPKSAAFFNQMLVTLKRQLSAQN